ncbi:MAG: HlyC/CorC family transporter [Gammaproteobacteria bacterium]|nr:HlyC/CorC family transporter [Gammaproteobacteria bacterium]
MFEIVVIVLLILANGVFAMSELAVVSSRRARLRSLERAGSRGAGVALRLMDDPTRFLSTVQIGITLVGVLAGAFSGIALGERLGAWLDQWPLLAPHGQSIAVGAIVLAVTYATLVVGELVPKRIALRRPERIAAFVAPAMQRIARVAGPAVWLLKASTEGMLRLLGVRGGRDITVTEEEVRSLIAEGTRAGVFVARERDMIEGVLRLADRRVRAIMTPRQEVVWIDENAGPEEIAEHMAAHRSSRYPVCRDTIDHIVGIVHTKDLAPALLRGERVRLADHTVRPLVVPEGVHVLKLLELFRTEGIHMAIVIDEYGATEGVATLADILEAITGDLPERGEEAEHGLVRRSDGSWLVDGSFPIDEFEDRVRLPGLKNAGDFDTVAGFVLHHLERLPAPGDAFEAFDGRFEVVDMDGHRIDKVLYIPGAGAASHADPVSPSGAAAPPDGAASGSDDGVSRPHTQKPAADEGVSVSPRSDAESSAPSPDRDSAPPRRD